MRSRIPSYLVYSLLVVAAAALAGAGGVGGMAAAPDGVMPAPAAPDPHARVQGMTISCHGSGQVWGTDLMVDSMAELKELGVNWITIHPYASISADGTVGGSRRNGMYANPTWLTRPIKEAHALGLKIMIKPHIAYWGSKFSWRGVIKFETEEEWARFFETYEAWITMVAELSAEADGFVVGTELDATVQHDSEWRKIIAAVRTKTAVPLTYSANWDSYQRVKFWDALDVIGIQSYFPLVDHDELPAQHELDTAWANLLARLEEYGKKHDRKIVLGELGYNRSSVAAARPWEYRQGGDNAEEVQRRCLTAALRALKHSKSVAGAFLWKWFPGDRMRGNFLLMTPAMRDVLREQWGGVAAP